MDMPHFICLFTSSRAFGFCFSAFLNNVTCKYSSLMYMFSFYWAYAGAALSCGNLSLTFEHFKLSFEADGPF